MLESYFQKPHKKLVIFSHFLGGGSKLHVWWSISSLKVVIVMHIIVACDWADWKCVRRMQHTDRPHFCLMRSYISGSAGWLLRAILLILFRYFFISLTLTWKQRSYPILLIEMKSLKNQQLQQKLTLKVC